jgi:hypothetical protein
MNKTIWIPIVGGFIFGALSFLISAANITITISKDLILGPWEIFNTISAALFGPIGLLITQFGMDSGGYLYLINGVFPAPHDVYFIICEYLAHSVSLLGVAFGYRFIYLRMKMPLFLAGWSMGMTTSKRGQEHHLSMSFKVGWERRPRCLGGSQRGNGTMKLNNSAGLQTWSANPEAMAGVR